MFDLDVLSELAVNLNAFGLDLHILPFALRLNQRAGDVQAGAGGDLLHQILVKFGQVHYNLDAVDDGAVVEGDEVDGLVAAFGSNPTFYAYGIAKSDGFGILY